MTVSTTATPPAQMPATDLTNCDRELIHIPGSIQPHGFLLAFKAEPSGKLVVRTCSENAGSCLGRAAEAVVGQELSALFEPKLAGMLRSRLLFEGMTGDFARYIGSAVLRGECEQEFQVVAHRSGELFVVEFERVDDSIAESDLNGVIAKFVQSLEEIAEPRELCELVTRQVRQLTGFDRVMLYRFDEEGHGTVLAEDRNDRLPSYLGQSFPASDIPRQARALYILNRIRIIPDVEYVPSPLVSAEEQDGRPLDLSLSILRSVSPVHRDYMRNMGTISSMSISIVSEGKLWGLISGHHSEPRRVAYLVRSACDVLSRIVSAQMLAFNKAAEMAHAIELKSMQSELLKYMAAGENYVDTLLRHPSELFAVTGAKGAAVVMADRCLLLGETPSETEVRKLATWITVARSRDDVYVTANLSAEYLASEELREKASGVLAITLSQVHPMQILWFRPEIVQTVQWAGQPEKDARRVEGVLQIHPRNSFAAWKQIVRGRSAQWSAVEVESAREFRNAVLEIVLKRAEELADMASELELANKELEAFSYSVSHDLRAPFRHISGFAELLLANEAPRLSDTGKRHLATIAQSAQFAGLLVDSLLNFSRITRTRLEKTPTPMKGLVEEVWRDVVLEEAKGREIEFMLGELPVANVDVNLMRQVWRNLLSNAVKYTRTRERARVLVACERTQMEVIFYVRDNGVGFDQQYAHKLFGAFQRLHRMEEFEGTGIGLANVRRIVARHGGRTWAEGKEGEGAAVFFSLPIAALQIASEEKKADTKRPATRS